jgi:hypothetical protein
MAKYLSDGMRTITGNLTPVEGSNTLMEEEVADGVFLIYDMALERTHRLRGSVMDDSYFVPGQWRYWSSDTDSAKCTSKAEAITMMLQAIEVRAMDVAAYAEGYRYRYDKPPPPDYFYKLWRARAHKALHRLEWPILEFNHYGGLYAT